MRSIFYALVTALGFGIVVSEVLLRAYVPEAIMYAEDACTRSVQFADPLLPQLERQRRAFLPDCRTGYRSFDGNEITISTNEDGLRDRPRAFFRDGTFVILGDSHVEGFGLNDAETLGRRIEVDAAGRGGIQKVLNLGFRGYGTIQSVDALRAAAARYRITGAIWLISPNDLVDDEHLRTTKRENLWLRLLIPVRWVSKNVFQGRFYTLEYAQNLVYGLFLRGSLSIHADAVEHFCRSVRGARKFLPEGAPLFVVAIPHGLPSENVPYFGAHVDNEKFAEALGCIGRPPVRLIDLRDQFPSLGRYLIYDRYHLSRDGITRLAELIVSRAI